MHKKETIKDHFKESILFNASVSLLLAFFHRTFRFLQRRLQVNLFVSLSISIKGDEKVLLAALFAKLKLILKSRFPAKGKPEHNGLERLESQ
jgi:hypothetical protein